jgi:Anp1 protein
MAGNHRQLAGPRFESRRYSPAIDDPCVLILTPVKQAARHLDRYFGLISRLAYPSHRLSLGMLESDSTDDTYAHLTARLPGLRERFARVTIVQRNFGFQMPAGTPRWSAPWQLTRRVTLAKSRNHLLFAALRDEDWVLWIDVDLTDYPADILTQLLATGKDIVHPHCVLRPGGPTFDTNAWRDRGRERMDALRGGTPLVRLDAVGGSMLLVRADLHRSGLIFPPYLYGRESRFARNPSPLARHGCGEVETEGLGMMAKDMGVELWGVPELEVIHAPE